jgi:hypothetical protein
VSSGGITGKILPVSIISMFIENGLWKTGSKKLIILNQTDEEMLDDQEDAGKIIYEANELMKALQLPLCLFYRPGLSDIVCWERKYSMKA